jgi:tetratricopeptide (TPR) repeat protein
MYSFRQTTIFVLLALTLVSCSRDPATARKHYLESGNKYFDRGRFNEAMIQYRNALKIDPKFGLAHYKVGVTDLKVKPPNAAGAVSAFRRAVELLKNDQAYQEEYKQSLIHLSELYLAYAWKDKPTMEDVDGYCEILLKKDPNSFDGYRLRGDLSLIRWKLQYDTKLDAALAEKLLDAAMADYRKADSIKPGEVTVTMAMAQILQEQKHFAEAESYYRQVIDKDKSSFLGYRSLYLMLMAEGKTADAEQVLKTAVRNNPQTAEYLERLAYHYGSVGRRDDMLNVLQQIKSHANDWGAVYQVVGDFYLRIGDAESALREFREGIVKEPKRKAAYQHSIIEVLMRQGKRAEAAEVNNQILKDNPKDADAKSLAATFLLDQGDINQATTELQAIVTSSPDNAVAHYQLGRAYLASGPAKREEARQQFEKAISLRGDMVLPRLGLAELQVMHSEYQAALDSVQEILKIDPGNVNARLIESRALLGQKKYGESDSLLADVMKTNPSSPDVYYQAGVSALTHGNVKEAEASFMRAYELNPANPRALLGVTEADIMAGKPDAAMALLETEAKKAPNRLDIVMLMGTTAVREGKYQDALTYFTRVLSGLNKGARVRADLYLQIADTYRRMGDRNNAIINMQKAREITPESETVLSGLAVTLDQAGRRAEARQAYEAGLKVDPNNILVLNNLAFLMAESNADLDVALNYAQKAKGLSPNLPEISDTYGWILLKKGLPEQAIPVFKDLITKVPAEATYHYHLAMAYNQKGDSKKAVEELREAMKHSPAKDQQEKIQEMLSKLGA